MNSRPVWPPGVCLLGLAVRRVRCVAHARDRQSVASTVPTTPIAFLANAGSAGAGDLMTGLNVGVSFTTAHAQALVAIAATRRVDLPDLTGVLGAGIPGAGRAELLEAVAAVQAHAASDQPTAVAELMRLVTERPAGPHPWSQALPPGCDKATFTLFGTRTDWDGCNTPSAPFSMSIALEQGAVVYSNVRAPVGPDGCFSGNYNDGSGGFSGSVKGPTLRMTSTTRFRVSQQGKPDSVAETRWEARGHAGGPGFDANADEVAAIRRRSGAPQGSQLPYGLAFGLPADLGDGQGDAVHRRGPGQIQGFAGVDAHRGEPAIIALRDGRDVAIGCTGASLAAWRAQWTADGVGALGYPLAEVRQFTHQGRPTSVQLFEGGYVFGDGTVEPRADAEAAFKSRFPEFKTPEEVEHERHIAFQQSVQRGQMNQILAPVYAILDRRAAERGQGFVHQERSDRVSAHNWIRDNRRSDAQHIIAWLDANYRFKT